MEYNLSQGNGSGYAIEAGNGSYGISKSGVNYSGGSLGNPVDYSDRSIRVEMSSSTRCPGGCGVCKGACRS